MIKPDTIFAVFPRGNNEKVVVMWRVYNGRPYLDLRQHYQSQTDPHYTDEQGVGWKFGKGITVREQELEEFYAAVGTVVGKLASDA